MNNFSIKNRLKSFVHAFKGIQLLLKYEHNAWIHLFALVVVVLLALWLHISIAEWIYIVFAAGFVFVSEAINTAIEKMANAISIEKNEHIKKAKDIGAGAVLIAAITAAIIGLLVFIPYFSNMHSL